MKKLIAAIVLTIFLSFALPGSLKLALAQENPPIPPAPQGTFILDTLDWLTPAQEAEINVINEKLDLEGIAQIAVVTLDDCGADKKKFRHELFNTWGIGHANDNDGLLILVCWYGGDKGRRSVEQEIGYGLETTLPGTLTDGVAKQYFVTAFEATHPGEGLVAMVKRYDGLLHPLSASQSLTFIFLGVLGFVAVLIIVLLARRQPVNKMRPLKREKEQEERKRKKILWIGLILVAFAITILLVLNVNIVAGLVFALISTSAIAIFEPFNKGGGKGSGGGSGRHSGSNFDHHSSGDSGGGGFGGGSSGGSGSSTGF